MFVNFLGSKYEFPGQIKRHNKDVWSLKSIIDAFYDKDHHLRSTQMLWDVLSHMMYFTPGGRSSRSLDMISIDQITELIDVIDQCIGGLDSVSQSAWPRCQQRDSETNIVLNPLGFVCFDPDVRGIYIMRE